MLTKEELLAAAESAERYPAGNADSWLSTDYAPDPFGASERLLASPVLVEYG